MNLWLIQKCNPTHIFGSMVRADQARAVYIVKNRSCFDRAAMYQVTIEKLFKENL